MEESIASLIASVQCLADTRTHEVWSSIIDSEFFDESECEKCSHRLKAYVAIKLRLHHLRKRDLPSPYESSLNDMAYEARTKFYSTPCVCGNRKDYIFKS